MINVVKSRLAALQEDSLDALSGRTADGAALPSRCAGLDDGVGVEVANAAVAARDEEVGGRGVEADDAQSRF